MKNNRTNYNYDNRNYRDNYDYDRENRTRIYYDGSDNTYRRSSGSKVTRRNTRRDDAYMTRELYINDREPATSTPSRRTAEARAVTRSKGIRQNVVIASLAVALVAAVAVGAMAMGGVFNVKPADTAPTSISTKADKGANKSAQNTKQTTQKTDSQQNNSAAQTTQKAQQNANVQNTAQASQDKQQSNQQNVQSASSQSQNDNDNSNIEVVNGERVYKDTKRSAPAKTGTPGQYFANGKTSYGFDWDYNTDNSNFVVSCDYNFNQQQYQFTFYGTTPGTAHVTLYYFTSDTNKVPVNLTVTVDDNLNTTVA